MDRKEAKEVVQSRIRFNAHHDPDVDLKFKEALETLLEDPVVSGLTSDGYHTFNELYDHRCLLWINLCLKSDLHYDVFWVRDHLPGWDLLVWEKRDLMGKNIQISYHVPEKYRELYEDRFTELKSFEFNGHTSNDVLKILESLARSSR